MIDQALSTLTTLFARMQQGIFEGVVQPLLLHVGLANLLEDAFDATGWLLIGVIELAVLVVLIRPLERWRPVEPVTDRAAVRVDMLYTLIHRLGLFRLGIFLAVQPVLDLAFGHARLLGLPTWQLDAAVAPLWRGITDTAWFSFALYLVIFDFADYWLHRGQHRYRWWWALHALHHSQRQMTMWTDNRNHLLDDMLRAVVLATVARVIGVGPGQFFAVVVATQLLESLTHANVRLWFGPALERLVVSPQFHRLHHSAGDASEANVTHDPSVHNFAVLLPLWDILFGTARFDRRYLATGILDQWPQWGGRSYGHGFWQQQRLGLARLWFAVGLR
jgi:sterol desaturase/sphingolipid hydroxylase (fatty acid hydroxylase superfamily)